MARERRRHALRHPSLALGFGLSALLIVAGLASLVWTPHDPAIQAIAARFQAPSAAHWLGTDVYGRDMLSRLMVGAQNSILVAVVAVGVGVIVGAPIGLYAALRGGVAEDALMRVSDFAFAFPAILSAIMITAWLGPGAINSILAIGIFNIPVFARLARGAGKAILAREFIMAARALGVPGRRIAARHVLPNIAGVLIVQGTIQFALAILADAGLSYLGLGIQPPAPTWGKMLFEAQTLMSRAPMQAIYPGVAIALSVLGLNLLGDGLRDVLDPRLARLRAA